MPDTTATIVAEATPPGRGGLAVLRLSGEKSAGILRRIFSPAGKAAPWDSPRHLTFGEFLDLDGAAVDRGLAVYFAAPASFTGEDVAECHLHCSPAVIHAVKQACMALGARPALPGEFSYRAVLNGRMGALEAEAANEMASFETALQAKTAGIAAAGGLQARLEALRERLLELSAAWEARIEFPEENYAQGKMPAREEVAAIAAEIRGMLARSNSSRPLRRGWRIAICGAPNVGKSSLFNAILQRERALVTPHPGTTRDVLEETVDIHGLPVILLDTAGIRESDDPVERLGVEKGIEAARGADGVLLLYSKASGWRAEENDLAAVLGGNLVGLVETKCDLAAGGGGLPPPGLERLSVSSLTGEGLSALMDRIAHWALGTLPGEAALLLNERQREALQRAGEGLAEAEAYLALGNTEEVALAGIGKASEAIDEALGLKSREELYDLIFSRFCIGK